MINVQTKEKGCSLDPNCNKIWLAEEHYLNQNWRNRQIWFTIIDTWKFMMLWMDLYIVQYMEFPAGKIAFLAPRLFHISIYYIWKFPTLWSHRTIHIVASCNRFTLEIKSLWITCSTILSFYIFSVLPYCVLEIWFTFVDGILKVIHRNSDLKTAIQGWDK